MSSFDKWFRTTRCNNHAPEFDPVAELERLEKELAEARVEINRRDELCKKCEREYEAELARYKQGVEVDGLVAYENYPWPIRILDTALEKFHHECVRVLVMKVEEG